MKNIKELREYLFNKYQRCTEAQVNKAVMDYAELIDFPGLIRSNEDVKAVEYYLEAVMKGEC